MNKFLATLFLAAAATAEADPYLLGYGAGYAGLGYAGYAGYGGLGYAGYAAPYAAGYASVSPSASVNIAGLAPAAVPAVGGAYAGAGRYVANSAGVVHVAKREAEADADAFYGAYGLGYAGLGYAGLGYAGLGYAAPAVTAVAPVAAPVAALAPVAAGYASVSPSASVPIYRVEGMTGSKEGCLILIGILLAATTGIFCQALDEEPQYDIDEGKALGLIHDLMRERPVYMLQALSNFGARLPNAASKRGIDFGLGRGFSGSQAAKHFMGMAAARYSGGPGKKKKRSQY